MNRFRKFIVVAGVFFGGSCYSRGEEPPDKVRPEDMEALVTANNQFSLALHRQLAAKSKTNIIASPFSISTALAVVQAGARGETASEMARTLQLTLPPDRLPKTFRHVLAEINYNWHKQRPGELTVANALWIQKKFPIQEDFLNVVRTQYQSELRSLDFAQNPEGGRKEINRWIEGKSRDKIRELIQPGEVHARTRLVVTNTVYLKKAWMLRFNKDNTKDEWFYSENTKKLEPMMHARMAQFYYEGDGVKLLRLPYEDLGRLTMFVLLPDDKQGMANLEQQLDWPKLKGWIEKQKVHEVEVTLPRVKMEKKFHLREALTVMGMKHPFTDQADFSGMTSASGMQIDDIIHQAYLSLDEKGTEAAAVTAVIQVQPVTFEPVTPLPKCVFCADHPFLLLVQDSRTGAILFTGRFLHPGQ
jgi:serpin B